MPDPKSLIVSADLHGFFRDEVQASRRHIGVSLGEHTEFYLVHLLVEYAHRTDVSEFSLDEPLLVLHQRAREAPLAQQLIIFKQMGDWALYVAGFFAEFIERSLVTLDYYTAMGTAAYRNVASLTSAAHKPQTVHGTYVELADKFVSVVDVLTQISHRSRQRNSTDIDLLKLYDRYVRTQNQRVRKMLEGRGLHVGDAAFKKETSH